MTFRAGFVVVLALALGLAEMLPDAVLAGASGPLPRFASLGAGKVNMRTGPGRRYPVSWVYHRRGLPVEIIGEYELWRKIRDADGDEGWIYRNLLSGRRTAMIVGGLAEARDGPGRNYPVVFRAEAGVIGQLRECRVQWCRLEVADREGWIRRDRIFGVRDGEIF